MKQPYNQSPIGLMNAPNREIGIFNTDHENIDEAVVASFGAEWTKFHAFDDAELEQVGKLYFDILDDRMVNKQTYGIDIGCGSGRWTKCLLDRIGFMEAIDPSKALLAADTLLGDRPNVRLTMASTDNIPFADETFDFGMSIGVLHHIPDTRKALKDCVQKIRAGGYFYIYLYYALDNKGPVFRSIHGTVTLIRKGVSRLPSRVKRATCDALAVLLYMPVVIAGRGLRKAGLKKLAASMPLSIYQDSSFFIIRNDALDRFGTTLEQRFTRKEVIGMMKEAGLVNIVVSDNLPYWHAVGMREDAKNQPQPNG